MNCPKKGYLRTLQVVSALPLWMNKVCRYMNPETVTPESVTPSCRAPLSISLHVNVKVMLPHFYRECAFWTIPHVFMYTCLLR
jgi:hypothetical protein